jgi:hypothetical protein
MMQKLARRKGVADNTAISRISKKGGRQENTRSNAADRQTTMWKSIDLHGRSHLKDHVLLPSTTEEKTQQLNIHLRSFDHTIYVPLTCHQGCIFIGRFFLSGSSFLCDIDFTKHKPYFLGDGLPVPAATSSARPQLLYRTVLLGLFREMQV